MKHCIALGLAALWSGAASAGSPPPGCPADFNRDAHVDVQDLTTLIMNWGRCPRSCPPCAGDTDGDCAVDVADLTDLILAWGTCPASQVCRDATGNCFDLNGTPGCEDPMCCMTVCDIDPTCCQAAWTLGCADLALSFCGPKPDEACCFADGSCQELPFSECASQGGIPQGPGTVCAPGLCGSGSICPAPGNCCEPHDTPGCQDEDCCALVCAIDPFCCNVRFGQWDVICVNIGALYGCRCGP